MNALDMTIHGVAFTLLGIVLAIIMLTLISAFPQCVATSAPLPLGAKSNASEMLPVRQLPRTGQR